MADLDVSRLRREAEFEAHATTYHRITLLLKLVIIHLAAVIAFLVVTFAIGAGFIPGLIVGGLIVWAGVFALRHGWAHSSERESGYPAPR
jgi:hypothetical protein